MKVKILDLFFALYSEEFLDSLMEYLCRIYSATSLLSIRYKTDGCYYHQMLVIDELDEKGNVKSTKNVDIVDILGYTSWTGEEMEIEIDVDDFLSSNQDGAN